jgi:hypothetical protein
MAEFTFGQVEAIMASLHDIADHKRVAFAGRLKFLQKNGVPRRTRPGRGKTGSYNFSQLMQLAAAVELLKSGMTPQRAARLIDRNWGVLRHSVHMGTYTKAELADYDSSYTVERARVDWIWLVEMDALADLTADGVSDFDDYEAIKPIASDVLALSVQTWGESYNPDGWRLLMINGTALTRAVVFQTVFQFRFASVADLRQDILTEFKELEALTQALFSTNKDRDKFLEDPIRKAELAKKLSEIHEADYTTNPPTPSGVLGVQALEILQRLSIDAKNLWEKLSADWEAPQGTQVVINDETRAALIELVDYGLIGVGGDSRGERPSLELLPQGRAAMKVTRREADPDV